MRVGTSRLDDRRSTGQPAADEADRLDKLGRQSDAWVPRTAIWTKHACGTDGAEVTLSLRGGCAGATSIGLGVPATAAHVLVTPAAVVECGGKRLRKAP